MFEVLDGLAERVFGDIALENGVDTASDRSYKVEKTPGAVTIEVEVPGCASKDVQVTLADGIITVKATTPLRERVFQFRVGPRIDTSDITAQVANGFLTLTAKVDQQPTPPQGSVKVTQG